MSFLWGLDFPAHQLSRNFVVARGETDIFMVDQGGGEK
jgi:hypothetical protein